MIDYQACPLNLNCSDMGLRSDDICLNRIPCINFADRLASGPDHELHKQYGRWHCTQCGYIWRSKPRSECPRAPQYDPNRPYPGVVAIAQTLDQTNSVEERQRQLPSSLMVCLVVAMSLWSTDSMSTVLKNLVNGLSRQWTKLGQYWQVPNSASITEARQRVGCRVMSQLLARIVRPMATPETPGACLGGLRVMAVDGTVLGCVLKIA